MITNLVCQIIVSLVTNSVENVTEWDHMEPVPCPEQSPQWGAGGFNYGCLVAHMKGVGPKKKERVTTVKEVSTLTFDWSGVPRQVVSERTVSEAREAFALEWNRAELKKPEWNTSGEIWIKSGGILTNTSGVLQIGSVTNVGTLVTNATWLNGSITNRSRITLTNDISFTPANPDTKE